MTISNPKLSIITPAYNESGGLPVLYERLAGVMEPLKIDWEWIIIDDHSSDNTFTVISDLAKRDPRVRGIRFSRNFGSHTAISCGLKHAHGASAVIMASDLQDPPETIPALLEQWHSGAQVVWAVRRSRDGEKAATKGFSRAYYFLMRHVAGIKEIPAAGADFFLIDRKVIDAMLRFRERNISIFALVTWMGFRQAFIDYDKKARVCGKSGWTLEKKFKLVVDSIASFSYLPIRLMSYIGIIVSLTGFLYAAIVFINGLIGHPIQGWASLMIVVLVIGGFQILMLGVLGEYVWRALDEARRRPTYLIEVDTDNMPAAK